jgi:hypothetical protein
VVKIVALLLLALILFLLGGLAAIQWMTFRGDTYPAAMVIGAFWLGGLGMTLIVFEVGKRLLTMIGALGDEPEPPAKDEDEDEEETRPPPRRPMAPAKPVAPALNMPGHRK